MNKQEILFHFFREELYNEWPIAYCLAKSMSYHLKRKKDEYCGYCWYKHTWWLYIKDSTTAEYDLYSLEGRLIKEDIVELEKYTFIDFKKINNFFFKLKRILRKVIDL